MNRGVVLLAVWALTGCSGMGSGSSGSTGGSSSSGGGGYLSYGEGLRFLYSNAFCQYMFRCTPEAELSYATVEDCIAYANSILPTYDAYAYYQDLRYARSAVEACAESLAAASCDAGFEEACDFGYEVIGGSDLGGPCGTRADGTAQYCRTGDLYCGGTGPLSCNQCLLARANGEACANDVECASHNCQNGTCQVFETIVGVGEGESCVQTSDCRGAMECRGSPLTCMRLLADGQPCEEGETAAVRHCMLTAHCEVPPSSTQGTCVQNLRDGSSCGPDSVCLSVCYNPDPTAPTGTCGFPLPLPGAGEACVGPTGGCLDGLYGELVTSSATPTCTCMPLKSEGQACSSGQCIGTCYFGSCVAQEPPATAGTGCRAHSDCASQSCVINPPGYNHVCAEQSFCSAAQCPAVPPANTSAQTAQVVTSGQSVEADVCLARDEVVTQWFRINGLAAGDGVLLLSDVRKADSNPGFLGSFGTVINADTGATLVSNCQAFEECTLFVPAGVTAVAFGISIRAYNNSTEVAATFRFEVISPSQNICPNAPANTSVATAVALTDAEETQGRFCSTAEDTEYFWRVPGSFAAGDLLRVEVTPESAYLLATELVAGPQPFRHIWSCAFPRTNPCLTEFDRDVGEAYLVTQNNPSLARDFRFTLKTTRTTDPLFTCPDPPTNVTRQSSVDLPLGQTTVASVCGAAADREFWFRIPGPFAAGDRVRFNVATDVYDDFYGTAYTWDDASMTRHTLGTASVYQYDPEHYELITADVAAPEIYIQTAFNPSSRSLTTYRFNPVRTTDPGFRCTTPPANQSAAAAATAALGSSVTGRFCSARSDTELWWRIPAAVAALDSYRLQVTFARGSGASNVDFRMGTLAQDGTLSIFATCTAGSGQNEDCVGTATAAATDLYVVTASNPYPYQVDETFDLMVNRQ